MITRDTIRSLTIALDRTLFDRMVASSGSKPMGEYPFLDCILKLIAHGTPTYISVAEAPDIALLQVLDGLLSVIAMPHERNAS